MKILVDDDHYPNIGVMVEQRIVNKQLKAMTTPQMYGRSKGKTFQIGEDYGEVMDWIHRNIDTQELEIPGHLENDVVTATTKKYRIAITEMIPKKEKRWLKENGVTGEVNS